MNHRRAVAGLNADRCGDGVGARGGFTNYDGDTFRATFRVSNIDTPEIPFNWVLSRRQASPNRVARSG